jgi:hypothetical protein
MKLSGLPCFTNSRNTGHKGCSFNPKFAKGDILVPYDFSVAVAETDSDEDIAANIIAALQAAFVENAFEDRAQFIGRYVGFEDKSEAAQFQKFNLGTNAKVNRTKYMHEYQYTNGGQDYHNAVLTYQGKHELYKRIPVEDGGIIRGVKQRDTSGALIGFTGIELDGIDVNDIKDATFTTAPEYKVMFTAANASELNEDSFAVGTGVNVFDVIKAVLVTDLVAIPFAATGARVHPFMIKTVDGSVNVSDTLGTLLNDTTLIASAVNKTSGVAIAVTSVALNTNTKKYVVTFTAGAGYVAAQKAIVRVASVSALHALDADYYAFEHTVEITMA